MFGKNHEEKVAKALIVAAAVFYTAAVNSETNTISSTVSSTVSSSSNTVSSGTNTIKGASTATSPAISITNSDICKYAGASGGVQTQVFGISTGGIVVRDEHCEKLKMARAMNAIGLKTVAAGVLAQDPVAFRAMWQSGVYPPIFGKLGAEARELWITNPDKLPEGVTLEQLLSSAEYLALKEEAERVTAAEETVRVNSDGERECKSDNGNYWVHC